MFSLQQLQQGSRRSHRSGNGQILGEVGKYILLLTLVVVFVSPFTWLVITALKTPDELTVFPIQFWPQQPEWNNFVEAFTSIDFFTYAFNSLVLSCLYSFLVTFSSALVGFGFARLKAPGKQMLFVMMLSTMMLPSIVTLIPTYLLFSRLNLVDTYWPWILWGLASSPFIVFLFRQFFSSIPSELEDAAIIDGCSYGMIFLRIFLPLSIPAAVTSVLLTFTWTWGDYITPLLLLSQDNTTLSVAMSAGYLDAHGNALTTVQAAGSLLYIIPVLVIFFFAQRYFVQGVATSGLKG